jgi:hypothetical protein
MKFLQKLVIMLIVAVTAWHIEIDGMENPPPKGTLDSFFHKVVSPPHPVIAALTIAADDWEANSFENCYNGTDECVKEILRYCDTHGYTQNMPHIALMRLVFLNHDASSRILQPINLVFLSGVNLESSLERIQATIRPEVGFTFSERTILTQNFCTIGSLGYSTQQSATSILPATQYSQHTFPYAHSEVAMGLYLSANIFSITPASAISTIIQIKNWLPMCSNCKAFWSGNVSINGTEVNEMIGAKFLPQTKLKKKSVQNLSLHIHQKGQTNIIGY